MAGSSDPSTVERRGLLVSAATAAAMAVVGIAAGVLADSQIILLDGFYALVGLLLSWLGLHAGRLIAAGPTERYPFGRETLGPLVVGIQGLVLLGSLGYAGLEAIQTIVAGGAQAAAGLGLAYAAVTLSASVVVAGWLRRRQEGSDLLAAEVTQWRASAVLSLVMLVGFAIAAALQATGRAGIAAFVDPTLVLAAVLLLAPTPLRMIRTSLRELLEGSPDVEVTAPIQDAVAQLRRRHDLPEPSMRVGKLGRKVYVELDFLVQDDDGWTVGDADRFRRELADELRRPGQVLWLNVELHSDPDWDI
ncbi:MAG: cation efflux family transporter [Actinomycetales bacterium]|nr:cation efflux family transporter [Actinomycetales bacterium]